MSSAHSHPLWTAVAAPTFPVLSPLKRDTTVDACIVGAGIAGLSVALELLKRGRSVLVIDREAVGAGETLRSSAHLASGLDDRFLCLERWHGTDGARLAAQSHAAAIDRIETWVAEHAIDCDFRRVDGYLFRAAESEDTLLARESDAALRAGLEAELLPMGVPGADHLGPVLRFATQARVDIAKYLAGLAAAVVDAGGVLARAEASDIVDGDRPTVQLVGGHEVNAAAIVVATNVPFHRRFALHTKQAAYRSFVVAGRIPRGSVPDALYWDTGDPYHYVRLHGGVFTADADDLERHDLLIVGGADHKTGQHDEEDRPYAELKAWAKTFCPGFDKAEWAWSGQILEPVDGIAFIGVDPGARNVYVVSGDSGNGLTHGTVAGLLVPALIVDGSHPWQSLYDPSRKTLHSGWLEENANVGAQYRDWLMRGDVSSLKQIAAGEGAIIRHGLHRFALYRDRAGRLSAYSARCPHLGCSVRWNALEKSWDCPCHGSRFACEDGRVLNGPADRGLTPVDADRVARHGSA